MDTITVELTKDEAKALLHSYEIQEFPFSNPWGDEGTFLLTRAENKLKGAIAQWTP